MDVDSLLARLFDQDDDIACMRDVELADYEFKHSFYG
jgi:hypothetical protein